MREISTSPEDLAVPGRLTSNSACIADGDRTHSNRGFYSLRYATTSLRVRPTNLTALRKQARRNRGEKLFRIGPVAAEAPNSFGADSAGLKPPC